jgi:hypothetical protein
MSSPCCLYICVAVYHSAINFWMPETRYVYHGTWSHLNGVHHKYFPSLCVSVYVSPLSLLCNNSVKTFPRQRRNVGIVVFYWDLVSKVSKWVVFPRTPYLAYSPYFEKKKNMCVCVSPIDFWIPKRIFIKLRMYIMASDPVSVAHFTNPSHQPVSVCVSPIVARQRLGKHVTAATNTHATIEEMLDASFSIRSVSYQGKYAISSSQNFLFVGYVTMLSASTIY